MLSNGLMKVWRRLNSFGLVSKRAPLVGNSSENKMSYAVSCELGARKLDASFKANKTCVLTLVISKGIEQESPGCSGFDFHQEPEHSGLSIHLVVVRS